jgi:hypothetical protein
MTSRRPIIVKALEESINELSARKRIDLVIVNPPQTSEVGKRIDLVIA